MATALEQLQLLPQGVVNVGSRGVEHMVAVCYNSEMYPHHFVLLMPWDLAFMKKQGIEVGLNYPIDHLVCILSDCPQLPLIQ